MIPSLPDFHRKERHEDVARVDGLRAHVFGFLHCGVQDLRPLTPSMVNWWLWLTMVNPKNVVWLGGLIFMEITQ